MNAIIVFVLHFSEYMGEAPYFRVDEYPSQLAFLRSMLLDDDDDIDGEDPEYIEHYDEIMSLSEQELIDRIEESNGDGQPFLTVINLDTKQTIIGNLEED